MENRNRPGIALVLQAALIVLPVTVLSGIALYSLRQDKAAILQDARERATAAAPDLAHRLGVRVAEILAGQTPPLEGVIAEGRIQSPPDTGGPPSPPDWPDLMPPAQAQLWRVAQVAIYQRRDPEAARRALTELLRGPTSLGVRANAELGLLALNGPRGYVEIAQKYPRVVTDSGAPLADVALLAALHTAAAGKLPGGFGRLVEQQVRERPSFLTPQLLNEAEAAGVGSIAALRAEWSRRQKTIGLLRAVLRTPPREGVAIETWLESDDQAYLALGDVSVKGWHVVFAPAAQLEQAFRDAWASARLTLPAYGAARVEVAGRRWALSSSARGAIQTLASAGVTVGSRLINDFTLEIAADEGSLYASYRSRLWLMVALIVSAAIAAFIGMFSLWRGFQRQVRLGEMKTNFVSSVSHELRAPIGAVRLMAENLERDKIADPAKQKEYFRLIVQECRRLSSLVENVLDFSRMDSGRKEYSFEPVELAALLQQAVTLMEPYASERGIRLVLAPPANGASSLQPCWDGQAIEQSLVNLLDNAIKHSPDQATVKLEVERVDAGVRLWVQDSGGGIPQEEHAKIFDLFYRHGSELRRETKGAGIGLAIVKHVAEAHGGRVLVESSVGQGSRFGLELPLADHV